jgi:AmmeMemoRadiSam system protein B
MTPIFTYKPARVTAIAFLFLLAGFGAWQRHTARVSSTNDIGTDDTQATLPVNFFIPDRFWSGIEKAKDQKQTRHIYAALVPHHLLAGNLISEIFSKLQSQDIKTVILIGPNHYEVGNENLQANATSWSSPLGKVAGINLLPSLSRAKPEHMTNEHSIAGLIPYVTHYLPKSKVFSIIIKNKATDEELRILSDQIKSLWNDQTVLIASVDFSHYLPPEVADQKDNYTKPILLELNEQRVYNLSNDYMDSPTSLALLFKICRSHEVKNFSLINHANSAQLLSNPYLTSTTSYFTGLCEER